MFENSTNYWTKPLVTKPDSIIHSILNTLKFDVPNPPQTIEQREQEAGQLGIAGLLLISIVGIAFLNMVYSFYSIWN